MSPARRRGRCQVERSKQARGEFTLPAGASGTIYYTTDGNETSQGIDPRVYYAGTVAATALTYTPDTPLTITSTTRFKVRLRNGTSWSALNEATFTVGPTLPAVRITELMYNPPGGNAYEFIELQNTGATPVDLGGWYFEGVDFYFPLGTVLNAGDRRVLGNNDGQATAFATRYPGVKVLGWFGGSLDNAGERIALKDASGRTIASVDYDDAAPWPTTPDGGGYSLEMIEPNGDPNQIVDPNGDPDSSVNWKASNAVNGTPGAGNSLLPATALVLNEVLAVNTGSVTINGGPYGYVELYNAGGSAIDPNGWTIVAGSGSFTFGAGASIAGGGFQAVPMGPGQSLPNALPATGSVVRLRNPAGVYADAIAFGNQIADRGIGRVGGAWVLTTPTVAADNVAATLASAAGNLVINEWLSNPAPGDSDWIELYNKHATLPVALGGLHFRTDTQQYRYPSLSFIAAGGYLQLFADEQPGFNQLDFTLPAAGTALTILDANGATIDSLTSAQFGVLAQGVSRGRNPDGSGTIVTFSGSASAGAANYVNTWSGPVLNDVVARNVNGAQAPLGTRADLVELYNPTAALFYLSGMTLGIAAAAAASAWTFPSGASIPAFGYLAIWCDPASPLTINSADLQHARALGDFSGGVYLFNTSGQLVNQIEEWGPRVVDRSIGVDAGAWKLLAAPHARRELRPRHARRRDGAVGVAHQPNGLRAIDRQRWFELYNPVANPVALAGLYLASDPGEVGRTKFAIAPLSFIGGPGWVRWDADNLPALGRNHVNFLLGSDAEYLRLSAADITLIDAVSFGVQATGVSQGRVPNGTANIVAMPGSPTPGASNILLPAPAIQTQPDDQTVAQSAAQLHHRRHRLGAAQLPVEVQWRGTPRRDWHDALADKCSPGAGRSLHVRRDEYRGLRVERHGNALRPAIVLAMGGVEWPRRRGCRGRRSRIRLAHQWPRILPQSQSARAADRAGTGQRSPARRHGNHRPHALPHAHLSPERPRHAECRAATPLTHARHRFVDKCHARHHRTAGARPADWRSARAGQGRHRRRRDAEISAARSGAVGAGGWRAPSAVAEQAPKAILFGEALTRRFVALRSERAIHPFGTSARTSSLSAS